MAHPLLCKLGGRRLAGGVAWVVKLCSCRPVYPTTVVFIVLSLVQSIPNAIRARPDHNNFYSSINSANFVKIGLVDVDIIGRTKITKNIFKQHNSSPPHVRFAQRVG